MDVPAGQAGGDRCPSQLSSQRRRCKAGAEEGAASRGIGDGEWRARLENGNAADGPIAQSRVFPTFGFFIEGQVITIADDEAVRAVEIGETTGTVQGGFVVEGCVECGVAAGGGVGGLGEGVCSLEVARTPASRQCGL